MKITPLLNPTSADIERILNEAFTAVLRRHFPHPLNQIEQGASQA